MKHIQQNGMPDKTLHHRHQHEHHEHGPYGQYQNGSTRDQHLARVQHATPACCLEDELRQAWNDARNADKQVYQHAIHTQYMYERAALGRDLADHPRPGAATTYFYSGNDCSADVLLDG